MKKKIGFMLGLLAGGAAAFLAFKKLDPQKREQLINNIDNKASHLKSHAIDYAFYASDAMNDASNQMQKHTNGLAHGAKKVVHHASSQVDDLKQKAHRHFNDKSDQNQNDTQFHTAADHLRSELDNSADEDDIVVNANDALRSQNSLKTVIYYPNGSASLLK